MKTCTYCGRQNEKALMTCRECGTEFGPVEPTSPTPPLSRCGRIIVGLFALFALGIALIAMPSLLFAVPLMAIFYLPIYLPFLFSFTIKAHEWRGLRWSLRVASAAAFFIWLSAGHPDFGDDVAGNIAGAIHNFKWTWGGGAICAFVSVIVGLLLRATQNAEPGAAPNDDPATVVGNSGVTEGPPSVN